MKSLLDKEFISEMICGNNFAYILDDNSRFLSTEYKVLHNQGVDGFIQCMQLIYNGKLLFYYLTEGYNALSKIISVLDAERFMSVACSLLENIIDVRNKDRKSVV